VFLKNYVADWPIKEYLKQHFTNQRNYQRAKSVKGKGKGPPTFDPSFAFPTLVRVSIDRALLFVPLSASLKRVLL